MSISAKRKKATGSNSGPVIPKMLRRASRKELWALVQELEIQTEEVRIQNEQLEESQNLLEESRDRYANLYDFAPVPFLTLTGNGIINEINFAGAALLGLTRGHLIEKPFLFFVELTHRRRLLDHLRLCRIARHPCSVELMLRGPEKRIFPVELSSSPAVAGTGVNLRIRSVIFDLTERKRAEAERERLHAIQANERLLRTVVEALPVGVRVLDRDGAMNISNATSARIWKIPELPLDQWGSLPARRAHDRSRLASADWPAARALHKGETVLNDLIELENENDSTGDETRFLSESAVPLREADGTIIGVVVVTEDVTDHVQAETRLVAAKETAERASLIKDQFLAVASHELRTPISAVLLWVHLLKTSMDDAKSRSEAISMIDENARAQAKLIDDLLDVSRMMTGKMSVNLAIQPIERILFLSTDSVRPSAMAKNIQLDVNVADPGLRVALDADRLRQIFWNLLTNAIKFTPDDGSVRVELRHVDGRAQVKVTDSGIGISKAFLPHIFEQFRQGDATFTRQYSGLGLGLSITRQLVEMHGGTIEASSPGEGLGTTMTVNFPLALAKSPDAGDHTRHNPIALHTQNVLTGAPPQKPLKGIRVLLVEYEPANRLALVYLLRRAGAVVFGVSDSTAARKAFHKSLQSKQFDVLISDLSTPHDKGYELMQALRKMESTVPRAQPTGKNGTKSRDTGCPSHSVPAIGLTDHSEADDAIRFQKAGFQAQVNKPVDPESLINLIVELTRGSD